MNADLLQAMKEGLLQVTIEALAQALAVAAARAEVQAPTGAHRLQEVTRVAVALRPAMPLLNKG